MTTEGKTMTPVYATYREWIGDRWTGPQVVLAQSGEVEITDAWEHVNEIGMEKIAGGGSVVFTPVDISFLKLLGKLEDHGKGVI